MFAFVVYEFVLFLAAQCLLYLIVVAVLRRATNEVADEACEEKLCADHHHGERNEEVGRVGDESLWDAMR